MAGARMTPSARFTANVGTFSVGYSTRGNGDTQTGGVLNLGTNNTLTATSVIVGQATAVNGAGGTREVTTANGGSTTINAGSMNVALGGVGASSFTLGTGASLTLRGYSGAGSRANLTIGNNTVAWGSSAGTMDLSGGPASLTLSNLVVGQVSGSGQNSTGHSLTLGTSGANYLDISGMGNAMTVGSSSNGYNTSGTVTLANLDASSAVASTDNSTAILLGYKGSTGAATGTLNLNGGTLTITTTGSAIAGGGGTSSLNISGNVTLKPGASSTTWIQNLTTAANSGILTIDTQGYNITIPQAFSGAGTLTKSGSGTMTLSGANSYTGMTTVAGGTLALSGSGAISSVIDVQAGGKLDASGAASPLTLGSGAVLTNSGAYAGGLIIGSGALVTGPGSFGSVTNQSGGFLTPGVGGDTNQFDNLTLNGGSTNSFWIGSIASHDMSVVTNALAGDGFSPLLKLNLSSYSFTQADVNQPMVLYTNIGTSVFTGADATTSFTLVDYLSNGSPSVYNMTVLTNNLEFFAYGGNTISNQFRITYNQQADGSAGNDIILTVIPEPGTMQLLIFLGSALLIRRKLRKTGGWEEEG